jgi:acyl carrier protein
MAKLLTSKGITAIFEDLFKSSKEYVYIVSPYFKIDKQLKERIIESIDEGLKVVFIYGKKREQINDLSYDLKNILEIWYYQDLHAKFYMNEKYVLITSMNLHSYSQENNREIGVLLSKSDKNDHQVISDCLEEFDSIKKQATCVSKPQKAKIEPAVVKVELPIPKVETESIEILKSSTGQKFIEILIDKLGVEKAEIRPDSNILDDLGADSLDSVELIMEIEKEFNLAIPDDDAQKLVVVLDAIKYLIKRGNIEAIEPKNRHRSINNISTLTNKAEHISEHHKNYNQEDDTLNGWYNYLVLKYPNIKFSWIDKKIEAKNFPLKGVDFSTDYGFCTLDFQFENNFYSINKKSLIQNKLSDYRFYWNKGSNRMMIYANSYDGKFSSQSEYYGNAIEIIKKELEKMML